LQTLMAGRTTLVIAHRLATITSADRHRRHGSGRIVEEGTHASLVGRRAALCAAGALQFRTAVWPLALGEFSSMRRLRA
jgi:ATP-binding cassette subfamily B protein